MPSSAMSSMSAVCSTNLTTNASYLYRRTPDELFQDIKDKASQEQVHLSASLLASIRAILNQAIVTTNATQDEPEYRPTKGLAPKMHTLASSSRGTPSRRQNMYGNMVGGAETVHRGAPLDLNQSFSWGNDDASFQELLPQVDQSTYSSAQRRADRSRAAREAGEQGSEQARIDFDDAETRQLQAAREARQVTLQADLIADRQARQVRQATRQATRQAAAQAARQADLEADRQARRAVEAREAAKTREAAEAVDRQTVHEASKAAQKVAEQKWKGKQPATQREMKKATSEKSPIIAPKNDSTHCVSKSATPAKSSRPSRLSQSHSAYTDREWNDMQRNTKSPSNTPANALATEPTTGKSGASTLNSTLNNYSKDNINDDTVKDSIEEVTDNIINDSVNTQESITEDTPNMAEESLSIPKASSPSPAKDSTYGSWPHNNQVFLRNEPQTSTNAVATTTSRPHNNQVFLRNEPQTSTNAVAATTSRIIKKAVGTTRAALTASAPDPLTSATGITPPSTSTSPAFDQSSGSGSRATTVGSATGLGQSSVLGKRTHDSSTDAAEPELKKTKLSK